ncbi:uncharacterized protein LOC129259306 [Lytechinus pictus]|uniref:uncharacterized protein LOC129259306 n=1 Tax=Lytechinus pictus TaxID=7653 RepID=UPI0030B9F0E9
MCSSSTLRSVTIEMPVKKADARMHDVFYSVLAHNATNTKIETLWHNEDLSEHPSASRDFAQFICKMNHLKDLTLHGSYHDYFYSTLSSMASTTKIETLDGCCKNLIERPSASRDLAQFICKMNHLKNLTFDGSYHDDFYSTLSSMASTTKIETLDDCCKNLIERPSASRDLAQFICKMNHLKDLRLHGWYHDDFYSTLSSMASTTKIETLDDCCKNLIKRPSASRDFAQFICKMNHLKDLRLHGWYHDDFYSTASSLIASTTKIETLRHDDDLSKRPSASRDLAQFICKMNHLKNLKIDGSYHDDFYSTLSSMASTAKIETLDVRCKNLVERPSASRDLSQFICKMNHLKNLTLHGSYHDDFYSTLSSMASTTKIETLDVRCTNLIERPSASRDLAQFICKMNHLKNLTLHGSYHDDFYSTLSSMASTAKIETLHDWFENLSERPSASRDLAQFICKMNHLKNLTLHGSYHDDFYSTLSSMASTAKIETLHDWFENLSERPSASRDLAQFICKMNHLKNLTLGGRYHDDFYSTSLSMASTTKIETLIDRCKDLSERPSASRDLAQFICKMNHLKNLKIDGSYHDDFYSTLSSMASTAKIVILDDWCKDFIERPSASRDLAQFICKMNHLKNLTLHESYHDDFYSTLSSMASTAKIETLDDWYTNLIERPSASRDLAQFICKMNHLKNLTFDGSYHDDFYSTLSSMASTTKIETLKDWCKNLSERPFASYDFAQFICKMKHLKNLTLGGSYHDYFYSTSSSMASTAKDDCNTSSTVTDLTITDMTLEGWQGRGSMFDNVKRIIIQVLDKMRCDVTHRIHLPAVTELTVQTHERGYHPASLHDDHCSLPNALHKVSSQLVKVTFTDLNIGNDTTERTIQAFRSSDDLKHLRTLRFIRCGTDESFDSSCIDSNGEHKVKVEIEHGQPVGEMWG